MGKKVKIKSKKDRLRPETSEVYRLCAYTSKAKNNWMEAKVFFSKRF